MVSQIKCRGKEYRARPVWRMPVMIGLFSCFVAELESKNTFHKEETISRTSLPDVEIVLYEYTGVTLRGQGSRRDLLWLLGQQARRHACSLLLRRSCGRHSLTLSGIFYSNGSKRRGSVPLTTLSTAYGIAVPSSRSYKST